MMRASWFIPTAIALATLAGCASSTHEEETDDAARGVSLLAANSATSSPVNPTIVQIVGRDARITVKSTAAGPTYSVQSLNGDAQVREMTLPQMQANRPDLARHLETMNAAASPGAWAGVE